MKKTILIILLCGVLILGITGCGKSNEDKMMKTLKNNGFECLKSSSEITSCSKEDSKNKKTFTLNDYEVNYEEIIYDSGTKRLVINISNTDYIEDDIHTGTIEAYFKGEDEIHFYPETCEEGMLHCPLHVGEKVYPALKYEYDKYKEYFNSELYRDYLRLKNKKNTSLSEELRLEANFEYYSAIRDNDQFTENVNDALRYYEKILDEARIKLER